MLKSVQNITDKMIFSLTLISIRSRNTRISEQTPEQTSSPDIVAKGFVKKLFLIKQFRLKSVQRGEVSITLNMCNEHSKFEIPCFVLAVLRLNLTLKQTASFFKSIVEEKNNLFALV